MTTFIYVGGYTTLDRDGRGNGINVFRRDTPGGDWTHLQTVSGLENPSLFTLDRAGTRLYSVHGARRLVSAFAIDRASGHLRLLNRIDCQGSNPVDSALDPQERSLIVANYDTGTVAVIALDAHGALDSVRQCVTLNGTPGPHPTQQTTSHPHAVILDPSGRFVIVPDKGLDRTFLFRIEDGLLSPAATHSLIAAPGAAPRHAVFHPALPVLYINNELNSTVTVYAWHQGAAEERQVIGTTATAHAVGNTTAEIGVTPDGRYLYVSNRGQDTIVRFAIASDSGLLTRLDSVATGGATPRFFTLDPTARYLYAGNQGSDSITEFQIDSLEGNLIPTGRTVTIGSPSAISFIEAS